MSNVSPFDWFWHKMMTREKKRRPGDKLLVEHLALGVRCHMGKLLPGGHGGLSIWSCCSSRWMECFVRCFLRCCDVSMVLTTQGYPGQPGLFGPAGPKVINLVTNC